MTGEGHGRRLRHLFGRYLRQVRGRLWLAGACALGVAAADLLSAWPLKIIIDHVLLKQPLSRGLTFLQPVVALGSPFQVLAIAAGTIILIALFGALFSYLQVFLTSSIGYEIVYSLRRELFSHLQSLSLSYHNRARSGDLLYRVGAETTTLRDVLTDSVLKLSSYVLSIVGICAIILALDWRLGVIMLVVLPCLALSLASVYRKTKMTAKAQRRQESQVVSRINEVLGAIPLVQAFARERYEEEKFDSATEQTMRSSIRIARLEAAATRTTELVVAIGTAATIFYGATQVLRGDLLPGELVLIVSYMRDIWKPIRRMASTAGDLSKGLASAERIAEILDVEPEIQDAPDAIEAGALRGDIVFRDVSFDYGDGRGALRGVSFSVAHGRRLALVGVSGAGKSTIVSLILRLYDPQQGSVLIDGVDLRRYRRASLRHRIGLVLQQSILFGATVRENIAYGRPEATIEEIRAAARAANADDFIRELPDGYDTVIGERGATLSGGQRQRIAIARALIRDASILILDEPMTGLDAPNEHKVREALDRLLAGRTCIQITHDLPSVADSDEVILLEEGRILDRGTHPELLARSRRYRELYSANPGTASLAPAAQAPAAPAPTACASPRRAAPAAEGAFPADPDIPHLEVAADPVRMREVLREHLQPIDGRSYALRDCVPVRFRCRQSRNRCVMQYRLVVQDLESGRERSTWVTGVLYARPGEAERLWNELRDKALPDGTPDEWRIFRPVGYVPEHAMLLLVFPFDRKLPTLGPVMGGALRGLGARHVLPWVPGGWRFLAETIEPTRYRTELGAALRYTVSADHQRASGTVTARCYLKVYRNGAGEETSLLLRSLAERDAERRRLYEAVRPLAYIPRWRTLVLEEAPGRPLQSEMLDGGAPAEACRAVARAVAALNTDDLVMPRPHPHAAQCADVRRAGALVRWAFPGTADVVRAVTEAIDALPEAPPAPIHRDLKPDHVFLANDRVTFIDLDAAAAGDPVRDPAHLYAHLLCRVGMDSLPAAVGHAAAEAFANEYFTRVPSAWRATFPVHCAGALLEVAGGTFKRQEPRWREKVITAVGHARAALEEATC